MYEPKHFKREEFNCHCCGIEKMDDEFLRRLDQARDLAGVPFGILSGYRCPKHNAEVGSKALNHPRGKAADIRTNIGPHRILVLQGLILAGFRRIGIAKTFIHADSMDSEGSPVSCWLY